MFLLNSLTLPAQIVINEIGIAPSQGNSGGGSEFIELFNKGGCTQAVDISCYVLMYSSTNLAGLATGYTITIPSHTILNPCSYYLIGGNGNNSPSSGWANVAPGGNPWINIYGANGRNPDLDISTSSNTSLQGLHPGEIIDFNGQFILYDASGQLVCSVSYNSGNNSFSYPGSFSNAAAGCTSISGLSDIGPSNNNVVGSFSSGNHQGIYLDVSGVYQTETSLTPGYANSLNGGTQICCTPALSIAPAADSVCFNATAQQVTPLIYTSTITSLTSFSISWNSLPDNSFEPVVNEFYPPGFIPIKIPAGTAPGTYTGSISASTETGCSGCGTSFTVTIKPIKNSNTKVNICGAELPYHWNGNTYAAAGIYQDTLASITGCDSIATLTLVVKPSATSTTYKNICPAQLPLNWNGNLYYNAGVYPVSLASASGCDSIAILDLKIKKTTSSIFNLFICSNQLPLSWNGNFYNAAGTYSTSLVNADGCDSVLILILKVNSPSSSTTNTTICSSQLPYSWNGKTYNAAGTYNVTLVNAAGCDSVATLMLTVNLSSSSTTNTTICSNQLPFSWNGKLYNAGGVYNVTLLNAAGCDSVAKLILTVKSTSGSTTNTAVCFSQLPYNWNGNTYNAAGIYNVSLLNAAGCDSVAKLILTVKSASSSSTNRNICINQLPYTWNGITCNTAGTYVASLVNAAGCDSVATLFLTTNLILISTSNRSICSNQLPLLWNGNSYNAAGIYSVSLVNAVGCDSIASLNLSINLSSSSTTNTTICSSQLPYSWNGKTCNAAGTYKVTLVNAAGCDSVATLQLTVNLSSSSTTNTSICTNQLPYSWNGKTCNAAGIYNVILVNSVGCDSVAKLILTVKSTSSSTTNTAVCFSQLPFNWNGNTYYAGGIYNVSLLNAAGCDSVAKLILTVKSASSSSTNRNICINQLPYFWNGITCNTAGTYVASLVNAAGCDSVASLFLTTNLILTSTSNRSICSNQLPLLWNGNSYNAAGIYSVSLVNVAGCDSIASLNLSINLPSSSTTNTSICSSQLPYSWNGKTCNAAGSYNVTLVNAAGCDSVATLQLTVNLSSSSTTNTTICSNQLPYSWNGKLYNAGGVYNVTLLNAAGCDSVAKLILTVKSTSGSTTNTAVCFSQLPYNWNGNTYNSAGIYNVSLLNAAGCDSVAKLILTVKSASSSSTNRNICINQLPYTWNGITCNTAGTYMATLVNAAGCDSVASLFLTTNLILTSTSNRSICSNQLPLLWNGNSYNAAGIYSVSLVNAAGCDSIASLNLSINLPSSSTTNTSICSSQLPYSWNGKTCNAAGTHNVTLLNAAGCDSVATLQLTVNLSSSSTTNTSICFNQLPYSWNGNTYNAGGIYNATLVNAAGCDSVAKLILTVKSTSGSTTNTAVCISELPFNWNGNTYNAGGIYNVTLLNAAGCDSVAKLILTIKSASSSSTNESICANQLPYSWNGITCNTAGTYVASLVNAAGCDSVASLVLSVNSILTTNIYESICPKELPFLWNGRSFYTEGTFSIVDKSFFGCDSISTLHLTIETTNSTITNSNICANQLPYFWNGNIYNAAGVYSKTVLDSKGCDSVEILILSIRKTAASNTRQTICSSQLPYNWNGQTFTAAGLYNVTLTNGAGCDSVATLDLQVNATSNSTTKQTICSNQLPFSWNGQIYTAAGLYNVTLTNASGCDSIATLDLVVNAISSSTTRPTICSNELPYNWNGNNYTAAGFYNFTLTNVAGCDSVASLDLTVNSTSSSTTKQTICNNQLPYNWNGNIYASAGLYNVTLTNAAGCDSIATLDLQVNATSNSTTKQTICSNQLPYSWNGNIYTAAGIFNVTLQNAVGCDSVATLDLQVSATSSSINKQTICSNQLPYNWNGNIYTAAGVYNVALTNIAGCDSVASLDLQVNTTTKSTTMQTICSNQLPYNWNGNIYMAAGVYNVTLTNIAGCDSVARLDLKVDVTTSSTTKQTICSNQLPYNWNGNIYTAAGLYNITLTNEAGCDSVASLDLKVNATTSSTTKQTICSNQLPYNWNGNIYTAAGLYIITMTNVAGCDSVASLDLQVNATTSSTTKQTICSKQLPYSWNGNIYAAAGLYNITLMNATGCDSVASLELVVRQNFTVSETILRCDLQYTLPSGLVVNSSGIYTSVLVNSNGCDSIITTNITFITAPNLLIQNPGALCNTATTDITSTSITAGSTNGITLGYWKDISATDTLTNPTQVAAGTYFIKATNASGCFVIKPVVITMQPTPVLFAGNDTAICPNTVALLHGSIMNLADAAPVYSWVPASGLNNPGTAISIANTAITTVYKLTVKINQAGCNYELTDSVLVKVQSPVNAFAGNDTNIVSGSTIQLSATGGSSYWWQPANIVNAANVYNPKATLFNNTEFIVTVSDAIGCKDRDTLMVKVFANEGYYVPNAFSPNRDGINDIFRPIPVGIISTDFFRIYNKYGQLIFETNKYMAGWDGTYKGQLQSAGNYIWLLKGNGINGKKIEMKGSVLLLK